MSTDSQAYMEIAKRAAAESGNYLRKTFGSMIKVEGKLDRDVKLEVDYNSESIITNILSQETNFSILSEERGKVVISEHKDSSEFLWIVDPLDGSGNYLLGIPLCCVSIGLWKNGKAFLGVIYDFIRDEYFTGIVNQGAWLNDIPIFTSEVFKKSNALLTTGSVSYTHLTLPTNREV